MVGKGRPDILAVRSPDLVLSAVAPLGLACAAGTALVIDLGEGMRIPGSRSLIELIEEGPRLEELSPGRPGVAVISGADADLDSVIPFIERLASSWPAVVVRTSDSSWPGPTVPVVPLYPGWLAPDSHEASVWQKVTARHSAAPGPGPVLPRIRGETVSRLLRGYLPGRSRWVRSWRIVWDLPWA